MGRGLPPSWPAKAGNPRLSFFVLARKVVDARPSPGMTRSRTGTVNLKGVWYKLAVIVVRRPLVLAASVAYRFAVRRSCAPGAAD
jgi:hypothetical protein